MRVSLPILYVTKACIPLSNEIPKKVDKMRIFCTIAVIILIVCEFASGNALGEHQPGDPPPFVGKWEDYEKKL
ncbi:unnamed protein product [Cylicocyclus nassatus]|uniref:Uncharacterized protein n=1 Tax=Cylicocyclus nassatus TaxID=53992 RepID=A0AA36DS15_CYLNA|nr:unnamed protein product [Cylicocyclus nassatus]